MQVFSSLSDPVISKLLLSGKVGVIPTDTTYGIVTLASNRSAVTRLYLLKTRQHKPGTVVAYDIDQLVELGVPRRYLKANQDFWPNPISVEIRLGDKLSYLHQATGRMAFRIPADQGLANLLKITGPLLTSSANLPAEPVASTTAQAQAYFGEQVDFYVDGGDLSSRLPSTIIRIIDAAIDVVRPGAVRIDEYGNIR